MRAPALVLAEITSVATRPPCAPPPQQALSEEPSSKVTMTMPPWLYQLDASTAGGLLPNHRSPAPSPQPLSVLWPSSQRLGLIQMKDVALPPPRAPLTPHSGTTFPQALGALRR